MSDNNLTAAAYRQLIQKVDEAIALSRRQLIMARQVMDAGRWDDEKQKILTSIQQSHRQLLVEKRHIEESRPTSDISPEELDEEFAAELEIFITEDASEDFIENIEVLIRKRREDRAEA